MAQWISFVLLVVATTIALTESRAIPAEPMMLDPYGNPIVFLREKRTAVHPYPQRAMMFTSYYRPVRRSNHAVKATGVFAQGNAVSGEAFFGGMRPPHLKSGPEPAEEPEVSSAEAQAAPASEDVYEDQVPLQQEEVYPPEEQHGQEHQLQEEDQQHKLDAASSQDQPDPESAGAFSTEAAPVTVAEPEPAPVYTDQETPAANRPKVQQGKKSKKTPIIVEDEEDDEEDDDEQVSVPFVPFKGNRRRQNYPNLNNYFPMVFSFPGGSTRSGSNGGSPPGAVTAIANSYSTGKGGVASSVATAYGGSPNGKKRRAQPTEE